jgi:hypothetical protein
MNKEQIKKIILDNIAVVNNKRVNENLSREKLIFNSGQLDALTYLLKRIENGNNSN